MTITFSRLLMITTLAVSLISFSSCKKNNFDEPNHTVADPNLDTISIARLRAYYTGGLPVVIPDDVTISGIVTADDQSGNFYKSIVIQDGSHTAIPVLIERSTLYTDYPIGRKIYVKCKGLVLGAYNSYVQLGGFIDNSTGQAAVGNIPSNLANSVIVKGPTGMPIAPLHVSSISELDNSLQAVLIQLDPVHYLPADIGQPYADVINQQSLSRKVEDCDLKQLEVRTSNFAKFATVTAPSGDVSIVGIYSVFGTKPQIVLREAGEVQATSTPCPTILFSENFNTGAGSLAAWQNIKVAGNKNWFTTTFSGNTLVKASAFNSTDVSNIAWLISPVINLDATTGEKLSFNLTQGQVAGVTSIDVLISTDYVGSGDPALATWTHLPFIYPALPTSGSFGSPTNSLIDISSFSGNAYVAFVYTGSGANGGTTTYEVDDVKVTGL